MSETNHIKKLLLVFAFIFLSLTIPFAEENETIKDQSTSTSLSASTSAQVSLVESTTTISKDLKEKIDECKFKIFLGERAIILNPRNVKSYVLTGKAYHKLWDYTKDSKASKKALYYYTEAIKLDPKNAYGYAIRGILYQDLGEYEKAIKDYEIAIMLDPNNIDYKLFKLSAEYEMTGEEDIENLQKLLQNFITNNAPTIK